MQQARTRLPLLVEHFVLGGGGSKGIGHLGALLPFKERGFFDNVKSFGGTSAGAMVGYNMALGMPIEFLAHFMGVPIVDKSYQRFVRGVDPTNLQAIVNRSESPNYFPKGMPDLALNMMAYRMTGEDPLHARDALGFDHPIVLEQIRLLDVYREYIDSNKRELEKAIDRRDLARMLEVLENLERISMGEWGTFVESLSPEYRRLTGLSHFSCSVSRVEDTRVSPLTFTSLPDTEFSSASAGIPMILAMAASASFPWALPPVRFEEAGLICIDGGIFQNLPYIKKLYKDEMTLAINLGHKPVQDAWDNGVFYNFGELKRLAIGTMFGKELFVSEPYFDCVHGFPIDESVCVLGLNEHAATSEDGVIATLTPSPTTKQVVTLFEGVGAYVNRALDDEQIAGGRVVVDFAGTEYGRLMERLSIPGLYY